MLRSYGLEQKLLAQHITQEKLISMRQADIDKLRSLTNEDRQHLGAILENYLSKHNLHEVNYSESMSELLKHNELSSVIGKMTRKRIAQKRLLSLSPATINELSFLEKGEKAKLPKVISKYLTNRAFRELTFEIRRQLEEDTTAS